MSKPASKYDSTEDTANHMTRVYVMLHKLCDDLILRGVIHDQSKLNPAEKKVLDKVTPQLRGLPYGSPEYSTCLAKMDSMLTRHYQVNRHHPEHWEQGIQGMTLVDLVEMFCDWCAATERHDNGDISKSIAINRTRFGYDEVLANIFVNTAREYGIGKNSQTAHYVVPHTIRAPRYTASLFKVNRTNGLCDIKGATHFSDDGNNTLCGRGIDPRWMILTNTFNGSATCPKCVRAYENRNV